MSEEILAIIGTLFILVLICGIVLARKCSAMAEDIKQLYDLNTRMSKVIAEHHEQIELLGINTEPEEYEIENEEENQTREMQKNLDDKYNEGMDNIFGYTVNVGLRVDE